MLLFKRCTCRTTTNKTAYKKHNNTRQYAFTRLKQKSALNSVCNNKKQLNRHNHVRKASLPFTHAFAYATDRRKPEVIEALKKEYFKNLKDEDKDPNKVFARSMSKIRDFEYAYDQYQELKEADVPIEMPTYNALIDLSPDFNTATGIIDELRSKGFQPNQLTEIIMQRYPRKETDDVLIINERAKLFWD